MERPSKLQTVCFPSSAALVSVILENRLFNRRQLPGSSHSWRCSTAVKSRCECSQKSYVHNSWVPLHPGLSWSTSSDSPLPCCPDLCWAMIKLESGINLGKSTPATDHTRLGQRLNSPVAFSNAFWRGGVATESMG